MEQERDQVQFAFFAPFRDKECQEEGLAFAPRFDAQGLIAAIVTDALNGDVLMFAYMNEEALRLTLQTGIAHYWSRSRQRLWKKGESSGNIQHIVEIRVDCDQDALWLKVRVDGAGVTCHTGRNSCFYRIIQPEEGTPALAIRDIDS